MSRFGLPAVLLKIRQFSQHNIRIQQCNLHTPYKYRMFSVASSTTPNETASSQFKYTFDNQLLTQQQRNFYEENGYLIIPNCVDDALLDECAQRFIDICEGRVAKGKLTMMKEISLWKKGAKGQYLYYRMQKLHFDEILKKYIVNKKLVDYAECFTGPKITAVHPMLINKPPDSGKLTSFHPPHQDLHAFPYRPADRIVAAWTAMEPTTVENGCLYCIPGSHRDEILYHHDYPVSECAKERNNQLHYSIQDFDHDAPKMTLTMNKRDTVFFHPLLIHGSGVNVTKGFRKSICTHYVSSECNYVQTEGTENEKYNNEVVALMKKVGELKPEDTTFDYWRLISIPVRGPRINI